MKIKKMTATFGTLQNQTLEPGPGLTVIQAPNESGKSTWCAFIRAMLYGIDTSEREKAGVKPDKLRYAPWGGASMSGSLELVHNNQELTLIRRSKGAAPMKDFSAVYTGTGEPAPLSLTDAGEELTGMPRAVFERTVFIRQSGIAVTGNPELEKRISSIVTTGEEGASYSEADDRLRAWQRKRRYNRKGSIPAAEAKIAELEGTLAGIEIAAAELPKFVGEIPEHEKRIEGYKQRIQDSRKEQRRATLAKMNERREVLRRKEESAQNARLAAAEKLSGLRSSIFGEQSPEAVTDKAQAEHLRAVRLRQSIQAGDERPSRRGPMIIALLVAIAAVVAGVLLNPAFFVLTLVAALAAALLFVGERRRRSETDTAREQLAAILGEYKAADIDGILAAAEDYCRTYNDWQAAIETQEEVARELEQTRGEQKEIEASLLSDLDFSEKGSNEASLLSIALTRETEALARSREGAALIRGKLKTMGDPLVIESELRAERERLVELEGQYDALTLAIETLLDANAEIQTRFSPRLSKRASELLRRLTQGRYETLTLDKKFAASAKETSESVPRDSGFLSAGALDQLYLALRIAIAELTAEEGEPCPIILDDALASFDDERMAQALELLLELAQERQILLFSCHSREGEYLRGRENVTLI